ncbi:hypothetical protein LXL04_017243 [Taraxacum kok-saghyz]
MDSKSDEYHGDGLTFFLPENNSEIKTGSSVGLPITNSRSANLFIVVEFDTFANAEWDPRNSSNDLIGDHVVVLQALHYIIDMLPEWVTFGFPAATGLVVQTNSVKCWAFVFNSSDLHINASNTLPPTSGSNPLNDKNITVLVVNLVVGLFVMITLLALIAFYVWRRKKSRKNEQGYDVGMNTEFEIGTRPKRFSYQELARSSGEFSENKKLGEGGFGGVYRGFLAKLGTYVAVKGCPRVQSTGSREPEPDRLEPMSHILVCLLNK